MMTIATAVMYLCIYTSASGRQFAALADNVSDAMMVAREDCLKASQSTNECQLDSCKRKTP